MNRKIQKEMMKMLDQLTLGYGCVHDMRKFLQEEMIKLELAEKLIDSVMAFDEIEDET